MDTDFGHIYHLVYFGIVYDTDFIFSCFVNGIIDNYQIGNE